MTDRKKYKRAALNRLAPVLLSLPWLEILAELWKLGRKLWRGLADEGMYEVLEHSVTLELLDKKGKKARVHKQQEVRYMQNNILAYQDQAWGDGEILLDYKCTPGVEVDRYRLDYKTYVLISLREVKKRGDTDEFNIKWRFRNGFLRQSEQWGSEVSHRTKRLKIQVVFPSERPPLRFWLVEYLRRQTRLLPQEAMRQLPDGRWSIRWETDHPRLHERYILKWEW